MQSSTTPAKFQIPFASSAGAGYTRAIPVTSGDPLAADFTSGFKVAAFTPLAAGGTPPDGKDFNGILNLSTSWVQRFQAGYFPAYDATFSGQIGGYQAGAILRRGNGNGFWRSTAENNTTNPDAAGAGWVLHGAATVFGRTGDVVATTGDYTADQVGALPSNTFSYLIGINGYEFNHATGLIDMWGETPVTAEDVEVAISFVMTGLAGFPNACLNMEVTGDYGGHTDSDVIGQFNRSSLTQVGCTLMRDSGGGTGYNGVLHWRAKGW